MALPPTIPTSFVPKQPVTTTRRSKSGTNVFMLIAGSIAGLSILMAATAFGYQLYLTNARDAKLAELDQAQRAVNIDTVEDFIRLKNRLGAIEVLLDQHVRLSEFFDVLEARTLQTVRFSGLSVSIEQDRSAEVEMEGVARTFNALAAQSTQFAAERRIKRAIFSNISVNPNGTVNFSLTATIDPRLLTSGEILPGISEPPASEQEPVSAPLPVAPQATTSAPLATSSPAL